MDYYIKKVENFCSTKDYLSIIETNNGKEIKIPWDELQEYWEYASYDYCEFSSYSIIDEYLVICLSAFSGQTGILGLWNSASEDWIYVGDGAYGYCGLYLKESGILISLSFISNYATPGHHSIFATRVFSDEDYEINIEVQWTNKKFNIDDYEITQKASLENYTTNEWLLKCGIPGLFYSSINKKLYAHDACSFAEVDIDEILKILDNK